MNREDIIRMAREAWGENKKYTFGNPETWPEIEDMFVRFAALVAAAEREACARVCEDGGRDESGRMHIQAWGAAKDIRARGETK